MTSLRRFVGAAPPEQRAQQQTRERCEMCGADVAPEHSHVVDVEHRSLMCVCRPCCLLFTRGDSGKYRAVPERYLSDDTLTSAEWQGLGIPVATAFFLRGEAGLTAFYPSPAGATECLLDLNAWTELAEKHGVLTEACPEIEAILIRASDESVECYLVPIDACYQLVGIVRMYWKGFDGGTEAASAIDAFFDDIRAKAGA